MKVNTSKYLNSKRAKTVAFVQVLYFLVLVKIINTIFVRPCWVNKKSLDILDLNIIFPTSNAVEGIGVYSKETYNRF